MGGGERERGGAKNQQGETESKKAHVQIVYSTIPKRKSISLTEILDQFIKLEDVASRFKKPCILDVKVGRRVWDDFAERDKIEREKKKYPPQEILGFRIIGMRVSGADINDIFFHNLIDPERIE